MPPDALCCDSERLTVKVVLSIGSSDLALLSRLTGGHVIRVTRDSYSADSFDVWELQNSHGNVNGGWWLAGVDPQHEGTEDYPIIKGINSSQHRQLQSNGLVLLLI